MPRGFLAILLLSAGPILGGNVQLLSSLPDAAVAKAIQLDAGGNIYVAGFLTPQTPKSPNDTRDAFVAKLSPDGSALLYLTVLSGSSDDVAVALALASDGSAYVAGSTQSADFPVTTPAAPSQGFLAKLDPAGNLVCAAFTAGATTGIAMDSAGQVFITGSNARSGFLLKLDATLTNVLLSIDGYGGGLVALDAQGNIYLAGVASAGSVGDVLPPLSPNAFQPTHASRFCTTSSGPSGFATDCVYQYVAKLDTTGALVWATYVTGTYGATPEGMAVDDGGNVILAGTTNSDDYPVTPGAFQTAYSPAPPMAPNSGFSFSRAPAATGYISKLNADGTGLIWSTYFGGTNADHITGMAVSAAGEIYLSGRASSSDLPVLSAAPVPCRPQANQVLGFVARLASDGAAISATQLVYGAPACLYSSCTATVNGFDFTGWPLALRPDGTAVVGGVDGVLASVDLTAESRLACVGDAADRAQLGSVAPGQIISLFGADLAPPAPYKNPATVTQSTDSFGVFFNGIPAPLLYSATNQINLQVPYEIDGQDTVQMQVVNDQITLPLSETRMLGVVQRRPSVFLADAVVEGPIPGFSICGTTLTLGIAPIALNADGTLNDCAHPAIAGSTVTIFVNGLGTVSPAQTTGAIASAPPVALSPAVDVGQQLQSTTTTTPGSITGVAQVQVQLRPTASGVQSLLPTLGGVPLPEQPLIIWTSPN
jgi:uncharacterized protein (TIGR03437 family)